MSTLYPPKHAAKAKQPRRDQPVTQNYKAVLNRVEVPRCESGPYVALPMHDRLSAGAITRILLKIANGRILPLQYAHKPSTVYVRESELESVYNIVHGPWADPVR